MTITFTEHEWSDHVNAIENFRYERERAMEEAVKAIYGADAAVTVCRRYREIIEKSEKASLLSPIPGTRLRVS